MRNIAFALAGVAAVVLTTPASAQYRDHDRHNGWRNGHHSGVSVHVGRAYARDCSVRVSKTVRSNGTVVTRRVRHCD